MRAFIVGDHLRLSGDAAENPQTERIRLPQIGPRVAGLRGGIPGYARA